MTMGERQRGQGSLSCKAARREKWQKGVFGPFIWLKQTFPPLYLIILLALIGQ